MFNVDIARAIMSVNNRSDKYTSTLSEATYINELQDRAMMGDVNAQSQLDVMPIMPIYNHTKRSCTCGSGQNWEVCTGINGDWTYCG